jgi:hypothetical protein
MRKFQIECGEHEGIVKARSPFSAWRKVVGNAAEGFGLLARYREYLPATQKRKHRAGWGPWTYVEPRWLDMRGH